jgi:hypothetical protein
MDTSDGAFLATKFASFATRSLAIAMICCHPFGCVSSLLAHKYKRRRRKRRVPR